MRKVLFKANLPIGESLYITPVIKYMKEKEGDDLYTIVESPLYELFLNNPFVSEVAPNGYRGEADEIIDLAKILEEDKDGPIVDIYSKSILKETDYNKAPVFTIPESQIAGAVGALKDEGVNSQFVAVQMPVAPPGIGLHPDFWIHVIKYIADKGYRVLSLGAHGDIHLNYGPHCADFRSYLSLPQYIYIISKARAFVCADTFLMYLAGSTSTPMVTIFSGTDPKRRIPYRFGKLGGGCEIVEQDSSCAGWIDRGSSCEHNFECLKEFDPQRVCDAFDKVIG